jgi:sugar/nucleoside kinase (ribokinase family)
VIRDVDNQEPMRVDLLILNTAVADLRRSEFDFVNGLVGQGGVARCETKDMPDYSPAQLHEWIQIVATAGGSGNTAPLVARAGLKTAVGVNLGQGEFSGLDTAGRFFYDVMTENGVDMSETFIHPALPTGIAFIHESSGDERGGIAYFPNANDDFDFEHFKDAVERLKPRIVYYMYSGLSKRGDANNGKDLADFMRWCHNQGAITLVDSHTLIENPEAQIQSGEPVEGYRLLEPLLGELDLFFTSQDEAAMIVNTVAGASSAGGELKANGFDRYFSLLLERFCQVNQPNRLFGVTVSNGAYVMYLSGDLSSARPIKVKSRFLVGEVVDLTGAGDSFRAGLVTYLAKNLDAFRQGSLKVEEAVEMGNLFAALYIKAPLKNRYGHIRSYEAMLHVIRSNERFKSFTDLRCAIDEASV